MHLLGVLHRKSVDTPAGRRELPDGNTASSPQFSSGYLFRKYGRKKGAYLEVFSTLESRHGLHSAWEYVNTSLQHYASEADYEPAPPRPNVKLLLAKAALEARRDGVPLHVLDIGVGTGKNIDLAFFEMFGISFDCTSLSRAHDMAPDIARIAKFTQAKDLYLHFPGASYDFVLSHYGVYEQLCPAVENAMFLLKPGGSALFSGGLDTKAFGKCLSCNTPVYAVKAFDPPVKEKKNHWFIWLQKTG